MQICPRCKIDTILIDYRDKLKRYDGKALPRYVYRCPRCMLQSALLPTISPADPDDNKLVLDHYVPLPAIFPAAPAQTEQLILFDYIPLCTNKYKV